MTWHLGRVAKFRVSSRFHCAQLRSKAYYNGRLFLATIAIISIGIISMSPAWGQVVTASLEGTVTDSSQAEIVNAKVAIVNTETGVSASLETNSSGRFVFTSLLPGGPYAVTVEAPGFKKETRSGIMLSVNQVVDLDVTLQVGSSTQQVTVVANANQLNTTTSSLGQVISNRNVVNLPLNQRNVYSLVYLVPGAVGTTGGAYNNFNLSVDGGRPGTSLLLLDGIPSAPPGINPNTYVAAFPSVDAIQEFKVMTTDYSAEFGRSGSGVINIILKSGTNRLHGSVYEFLRNSALDANSYFSNLHNQPLPLFHRSQFGASIDGPVVIPKIYDGRNKTFFMFSYEGLRQGSAAQLTATVPTALQRTGDFSSTFNAAGKPVIIYDPTTTTPSGTGYVRQPFPNDKIPSQDIDPVAAKVLSYYPLPNVPGGPGGVNNFFATGTNILTINGIDTKVTEVLNDRNRFFVRYSQRSQLAPPTLFFPKNIQVGEGGQNQPNTSHSAAIDYTFTASPTFVIEIPFGFSRQAWDFTAISNGFNPSTLGFPSYIAENADHLVFPGIAPANYYTLGDSPNGQNRRGGSTIFMLGDNNTKIVRNHVIGFGGTAWLLQGNDIESGQPTGSFSFTPGITQGPNPNAATSTGGNSIASLLLGVGSSGNMTVDSKNAATTARYFGLYIQDDWRVTPRLTLNGGVRYDLDIPRTERYNRMETFDPTVPSPLARSTGLTGLVGGLVFPGVNGASRRQFSPQWKNFGPRLGLAFDAGHGTVIHTAYGIYYGATYFTAGETIGNEGFSATTAYNGSPNGLTPSVFLSNPFPSGINRPVGSTQGLLTGIGSTFNTPLINDNKVPYTENWNLDVQHQFGFQTVVDVSYVGSHGVHLNKGGEGDWNANQLSPSALALGNQLQQSVPNPFFGIITNGPESGPTIPRSFLVAPFPQYTSLGLLFPNGGYMHYDSFRLKVSKSFSRGLSFLVSYTGSKQLDNYSGIENVGNTTGGIQNIYNPSAEYAVSSNDISRNLVISGIYDLPFGRGRMFGTHWNRPTDFALGGWQVNGITMQQNGFPLSPTTQNTSGSGSNVLRPNMTGIDPATHGSMKTRLSKYVNPAAFSQPAPFTFGNAPRTLSNVRAPGTQDIDLSLFKNFPVPEHMTVQFRAESFNLLNQVVFGKPNMSLTSGQFGVISSQANTPREIQFALKILF